MEEVDEEDADGNGGVGDERVEGDDEGVLGGFDSFVGLADPAADSPSCFFHLVRRF